MVNTERVGILLGTVRHHIATLVLKLVLLALYIIFLPFSAQIFVRIPTNCPWHPQIKCHNKYLRIILFRAYHCLPEIYRPSYQQSIIFVNSHLVYIWIVNNPMETWLFGMN